MCFFCYVSRHFFFHQTYAGARKKNKMPKEKKRTGSVSQATWPTNDTLNSICWEQSFFRFILTNNDRVKQFPVATKVWLFLVLDLPSRAKNVLEAVQPKRSSTLRMHSSCRDRSLDRKLERGLDSKPNTYPDVFVKARPHYSQQSHRSMISTERILAFGFHWQDSITRLLKASAWFSHSRQEGVKMFSSLAEGHEWRAPCLLSAYFGQAPFSPKEKKKKNNPTCRDRCAQSLVRESCSRNNVVEPVGKTSLVLDTVFGHELEKE